LLYIATPSEGDSMKNLLEEQRLTLTELARKERVNVSTVWRWTLRGVRGIKLESFSVGARRFTTAEAFIRFVDATTAAAKGGIAPARTRHQRAADISRAERELQSHGI
jgi:hypothetical protein